MTAVALMRDLFLFTRLADAAARAGVELRRVEQVEALPHAEEVALLLVDWSEREATWGARLTEWSAARQGPPPRIVLFGPHTDRAAHAAARNSGLGPMWARSKLVAALPTLFAPQRR